MRRPVLYVIVGAGAFFTTLLATPPARLLASVAQNNGVAMTNPSGTVWSGSATSVSISGLRLGQAQWRLNPLTLFTGRPGGSIDAKLPSGFVRSGFRIGGKRIELRDLEATTPLSALAPLLGLNLAGGDVSLQMAAVELREGWPSKLQGQISLGRVPLLAPGASNSSATGNFRVEFSEAETGGDELLTGVISDLGGAIEISGQVTLGPARSYELSGLIRARAEAPASFRDSLNLLGPPDAEGRRQFSLAGSL